MPRSGVSEADRAFFTALRDIVFANPFSAPRTRLIARLALFRILLSAAACLLLHRSLARRRMRIHAQAARSALEQRLHPRYARIRGWAVEPDGGFLDAASR